VTAATPGQLTRDAWFRAHYHEAPSPESWDRHLSGAAPLRDYLDDFTRAVIDLDAGRDGNFARAAHSVREKAALAPVETR
jgi:1,6-anhydro-N-acetylmuramate kinase